MKQWFSPKFLIYLETSDFDFLVKGATRDVVNGLYSLISSGLRRRKRNEIQGLIYKNENENKISFLYSSNDNWFLGWNPTVSGAEFYKSTGNDLEVTSWIDVATEEEEISIQVVERRDSCEGEDACGSGYCAYDWCHTQGFRFIKRTRGALSGLFTGYLT